MLIVELKNYIVLGYEGIFKKLIKFYSSGTTQIVRVNNFIIKIDS